MFVGRIVGCAKPHGPFQVPFVGDEHVVEVSQPMVELHVFKGKRQMKGVSWEASMATQRVAATRKWAGLLLEGLECFSIGRQLAIDGPHGVGVAECLGHVFSGKATSTLNARAGPLLRYVKWCRDSNLKPFPLDESSVYRFMCLHSEVTSPSFLKSLVTAISFSYYVLGVSGGKDCIDSRRIEGLAKQSFMKKRKTCPKDPLSVAMVRCLEDLLDGQRLDCRDSVAAGCFLLCVYMRARYSDMLVLTDLKADELLLDGMVAGYIEGSVGRSKTLSSTEKKVTLLPMACPRLGLTGVDWFSRWQEARARSGVPRTEAYPLLPAPARTGWTRLPLPAHEAADWLRKLLGLGGVPKIQLANVGTHSCKATCLSWCAKFGLPISVRRTLGYHMKPGDRMPILYSRDAIAAPLRDLERVLGAIRSDGFRPDLTRSGYFVRGVGEDARQGLNHADDRYSDVSSSEASIDNDDRDKDLEAEELAQDAVLDEWVEYGSHVAAGGENPDVFRHKSSRFLHVAVDEGGARFKCGRKITESYVHLQSLPRFSTPQCKLCFRSP